MPKSYQVSMVRGSHDHHAPGAWSLKDRSETDYSSEARGRTVSTHILGLGIVLVGVLLLAVGLIMGLEFPKYVHEQYKGSQCVVSPDQETFSSWSTGTQWDRKVKIYFWILTNVKEFLYQGAIPKFTEKGPYVYTESETKEDIVFSVTEVSYRLNRIYKFDGDLTASECRVCQADDMISIINPWYLQVTGQVGGETALAWSNIPKYVTEYLKKFGFIYTDDDIIIYNSNISALGIYSSSTPLPHQQSPWGAFNFGAWLSNNTNTSYGSVIASERRDQPFTASEVTALYKVFSNLTLLGGQSLSLPNLTLLSTVCENWSQSMCSSPYIKLKTVGIAECGVYFLLKNCPANNMTSGVRDILQRTFCPPGEDGCLNVTGTSDDLLPAYKNAIFDFLIFVSGVVLNNVISSWDLSLVTTRNQSELALGYDVTGDSVIGSVRVPGLLQQKWKDPQLGVHPLWKVLTCLENRDMDNNMVLQEYNDLWSTPGQLLKNPSLQPSLSSFTDFVTSCGALRACATCYSLLPSINFFVEDLLRPVSFHLNSSWRISDVDIYNYTMSSDVFKASDIYLAHDGLQTMSGVTGYMSWVGLPYSVGGSTGHLTLDGNQRPADSFVGVEPITGRVWSRQMRLQWNVAVRNETAVFQGRKISTVDLPLPVYWLDRSDVISDQQVAYYKHLVHCYFSRYNLSHYIA